MISPFLPFFLLAPLYMMVHEKFGKPLLLTLPFLSCFTFVMLKGYFVCHNFMGEQIILFRADSLNTPFFIVFLIITFLGFLYQYHEKDKKQDLFPLLYAGSAIGVIFAGDFLTLFFFWELMALFSTLVIWNSGKKSSAEAGLRYLLIHLLGGFSLLAGIMVLHGSEGSFAFRELNMAEPYGVLILIGFLINAAVPPFSAWLPDAYPEAGTGGSVFLSAFTTKSAVYVLIRFFSGNYALVILGSVMAVYGVIYAFLVLDMRRLLSYHIISQVGFMIAGTGIGTSLSINGAVSHAFTHIVYKGLLFMSVGSIIYITGRERLNEIGGLVKKHGEIMIYFMIGALSISGMPLLSGFVTKSLTITAAQEEHNVFAWFMLNIASTGTFISVALKLPYLAFMGEEKNPKEPVSLPLNMKLAMLLASLICFVIGIFPEMLYKILPYHTNYRPYTLEHVIFVLELFCGGLIVFILYMEKLKTKRYYIILDTDWFYRKGTCLLLKVFYSVHDIVQCLIMELFYNKIVYALLWFIKNPVSASKLILEWFLYIFGLREKKFVADLRKYPMDTVKHWPIGITVFYVTLFLLIFLLTYYAS